MIYEKEINGVSAIKDAYGEHFSNEVKVNYVVSVHGECVSEGRDTKLIAKELDKMATQLLKWSAHFNRMKQVYKEPKRIKRKELPCLPANSTITQ